ncbi:MAG: pyrroline-5-carboxylate reductase [Clostridia bacterium]|nr:pyrroline-5-carboxylate reductase [Clostridia bacterium]
MKMKFGFIGSGNMATAIVGGIIGSDIAGVNEIIVSDINEQSLDAIYNKYKVATTLHNKEVAESDILFLCVKPNVVYKVIDEIKDFVTPDTVVVSIVAGQSIEKLEKAFEREIKLVRVMPNTPALVGEGMSALSKNANVSENEIKYVEKVFNGFGIARVVDEKLMDAVTAVSGSSPAYAFMMIEAMADGAVMNGMPRDMAYTFAAQALLGSAKMVLDTGMHPGALKDMVCSPGGTTIEAVRVLEQKGFRGALIEAVNACAKKSKELG